MNQKLRLRSSVAAAAWPRCSREARWPRRPPAAAPPPNPTARSPATSALFSQYVFRGISQTEREAGAAGRLRPRATERLLRRHLGVEHQLAVGRQSGRVGARSNGTSTAASSARCRHDFVLDVGVALLLLSRHAIRPASSSRTPSRSTPRSTGSGSPASTATASTQYFGVARFATAPTTGSSTSTYDIVEKVSDADRQGRRSSVTYGQQKFKNNGVFDYTDWKVGVSTEV